MVNFHGVVTIKVPPRLKIVVEIFGVCFPVLASGTIYFVTLDKEVHCALHILGRTTYGHILGPTIFLVL